MIIFNGFWAGFICGVCAVVVLVLLFSLHVYNRTERFKAQLLFKALDSAAKEKIKGEDKDESSN